MPVAGERSDREVPLAPVRGVPCFDVVVIGASAGGIHALITVLTALPEPFPVTVALVLHLSPAHSSVLAQVLSRSTGRPIAWAEEGSPVRAGAIYAAPPDRHLEFDGLGATTLATSPPVHHARPSVDRLFTSAAKAFGQRTLAVLLSGSGADGAAGALIVSDAGGVVIAQDEASSEYFGMPREAIGRGAVTLVLPLDNIARTITDLVRDGVPDAGSAAIEFRRRRPPPPIERRA